PRGRGGRPEPAHPPRRAAGEWLTSTGYGISGQRGRHAPRFGPASRPGRRRPARPAHSTLRLPPPLPPSPPHLPGLSPAARARPSGRSRVMAKIGYARVSTRSQKDDSKVDDLTAYGCDKIFTDTVSGKLAARTELDKALAYLHEGDVLVITRLSRAMRSLKHL